MGDAIVALHPGGDPGSMTMVAVDPDRHAAALVFANVSPNKRLEQLEKQALKRLLEKGIA